MTKTNIVMNEPVYLGLSVLELSKIFMYEFWYNCVKPKYGQKTKLIYLNNCMLHCVHKNR